MRTFCAYNPPETGQARVTSIETYVGYMLTSRQMLHWAYNVDHFCSGCQKHLTHKHHDGLTQLTEETKARMSQMSGQGPQFVPGQLEVSQPQPAAMHTQ